ncbi:uncharacterized protein [Physcomitrium patens]|uniref:UDENN domain-containing protein n=2 Tax=Physcomitrium patens TaxID=3218 RepID=A0A2K1JR93_PHYPA|nr:protein DENND6B-like [Physcomitrium patens]XP_024391051.1 protein DENND6B-like [Physcomitrium patens]XP_024391052.1 protein DENND6B-like [Physcomitrium patens]XP_024391053.1 protein DENND6B-like [Physcomitrium patens]XP_024391054.1 protein DENND6B-like [Physcomitrium patens]XP_024391055.1 protein DENND6B-like [Physcomitrium patens]XP_024391056.1 protein DENND6B-like [Physcomitrium patens]XP_024391057.1 protein DENND6B-like [Physcomitrium patens]XP_024391058.1 protein DENND6B-like [Physco|eukprot:XP_024391050.1 protein DENND6B-like [Physcomitrella patens]
MNRSVTMAVPRHDPVGKAEVSAMQRWIVAICAIRFDLQQGQLVEECYPANALSPEEELDVAFSSFPDSMSQGSTHASVHDCAFFFRIRRRGSITALNPAPPRRTIPHPPLNAFSDVGAVDDTARQLNFDEPQVLQSSLSEGPAALEVSPAGKGVGMESGWGSLPLPGILANVISPKPAARETSNSTSAPSLNISPSCAPVHSEKNTTLPAYSLDSVNGISRGGPGSGGPRYLYGFVFNRQRQDEKLRRGGEQKSVVVLSERPYSCVFKPLVQIAGPLYFDIGARALEQVASYVSCWAPPLHGQLMELLVGNIVIRAHLPPAHTLPPGCGTPMDDFTSAMAPVPPLNRSIPQGVFHDIDLFGSFRGVLMNLWVLWELLLVGEPLLVIAPTPSQVCEAVAALVGLVAPLPCSVDFRPYFTIHDPDFSGLNSVKEGEKAPPMVLGVTNLFFLKALRNIPHVISVGTPNTALSLLKLARSNSNSQAGNRRLSLQLQLSPLTRFSPANLLKVARVRKDGPLSLMSEHRECLWSSYVAATKPDTSVLNRLVDAGVSPRTEESMSMVNNEVLKRHFLELTTNFLAPFGPYLRATTPQEGSSPFRDPPPLPPFNAHAFLEGLAARGAGKFLAKRLRANWLDLYKRFLEGPNFMPWFQRRRAVAEQEQHRIWRQARCKADVESFLTSMSEVEIVDSFSAVERHFIIELQMLQRAGLANTETQTIKKLRSDLHTIFNLLPNDVQQMLLTNPQRASHLQWDRPENSKAPEKPSSRFGLFWPTSESSQLERTEPGGSSRQLESLQVSLDLNRT